MKSLQELFPRSSKSFQEANSAILPPSANKNALAGLEGGKKRGSMNKTEAEFALILEAQKGKGEIDRYEFEPVTFRFAGVRYTPDFLVIYSDNLKSVEYFRFIELKGGLVGGK